MAPDIAAYVPLLPAVFGEAGRHQGPLPYHLADVAVARTHPMLEAFSRLLSVPESRLTAPVPDRVQFTTQFLRQFAQRHPDRPGRTGWHRPPEYFRRCHDEPL